MSSLEDKGLVPPGAIPAGTPKSAPTFTPGPWTARMQFGEWFVRQDPVDWDGRGYLSVCVLPAARKKTASGETFAANARLIASAPDLLETLQRLVSKYGYEDDGETPKDWHEYVEARAAIAKATGQENTAAGDELAREGSVSK